MTTLLNKKRFLAAALVLLLALKLPRNLCRASTEPRDGAESFQGKYTWSSVKDLDEPLSFVGSESRSLNSVVRPRGDDILGTITYGESGRWVGKAIPYIQEPFTNVVSTSVTVRGGEPDNGVYDPYGVNQRRFPNQRTPAPPSFNNVPYNNFIPYGEPNYYYYGPFVPYYDQNIPQYYNPFYNEFLPVGRSRNLPVRYGDIKFTEVDPSIKTYLYDDDSKPTKLRSSTKINESVRLKRTDDSNDWELVQVNGSTVDSSQLHLVDKMEMVQAAPISPNFTGADSEPRGIPVSPETVATNPEVPARRKFVPINFQKATSETAGSAFSRAFKVEDLPSVQENKTAQNISQPQLKSKMKAPPPKNFFSLSTDLVSEPKNISASPETVTDKPVLTHQGVVSTKFVPIAFLVTTPRPAGLAFGTFNIKDSEPVQGNKTDTSQPQLWSKMKVPPSKNLSSDFTHAVSEKRNISVSPETDTNNSGAVGDQRFVSSEFIPITFIQTTYRPTVPATFGSFTPKPIKTPTDRFIPNFIPTTRRPMTKFNPGAGASPDETDANDVDRVISDIIRVVPATRRGNPTTQNREDDGLPPSKFPFSPESNPENFPGLNPYPPPPLFPGESPPRRLPDVDEEGWTVIKSKFQGTITRTPFEEPPGGRPVKSPDVEFIPALPANDRFNPMVIDKALASESTETKFHKDVKGPVTSSNNYFDRPGVGNSSPVVGYLSFTTMASSIIILWFYSIKAGI